MRVCIFGSRTVTNATELKQAIADAALKGIMPTVVLSGREPNGADRLGEVWAAAHDIPVEPYPADWENLETPGAVIRHRRGEPYNARAGPDRNERMAAAADAGIALDAGTPGTRGMIAIFRRMGKLLHVHACGGAGDGHAGRGPGLFDSVE